jgi:hypothetical protein
MVNALREIHTFCEGFCEHCLKENEVAYGIYKTPEIKYQHI